MAVEDGILDGLSLLTSDRRYSDVIYGVVEEWVAMEFTIKLADSRSNRSSENPLIL